MPVHDDDRPTFDLQAHSIESDGSLPPSEVVGRAAADGVALLALTDHDTVNGVGEAIAAARRHGIGLVPAVELSSIDEDEEDLHVCGYLVDHEDSALLDALQAFRADRTERIHRMANALRDLGFQLATRPIERRLEAGQPIGRPHLAAAVASHPSNARRLAEECLATPSDVLETYLVPGAPAYRRRTTPTVAEAIDVIHAAGGVAVWAHPFWDLDADAAVLETIDRFAGLGLDGVEAFYVTHTREQTLLLADACEQRGLLSTGSTDFHSPGHPRFSAFRGFRLHGREPNLGPIAEIA